MALDIAINDLKREIAVIFDNEKLKGLDLYAKKGALTYLVGNVNSIALKERHTASVDRQIEIDSQLLEINAISNGAFARLDYLNENPLPAQTGTKPKSFDSPRRKSPTPTVGDTGPKGPPDSQPRGDHPAQNIDAFENTNPFINVEGEPEPQANLRKIEEERLLKAIYTQIQTEFDRILKNPNFCPKPEPNQDNDPDYAIDADPNQSNVDDQGHESVAGAHSEKKDAAPSAKKGQPVIQPVIQPAIQPMLEMKFDKIQLSEFAGDYTKWISFRDEFVELVHTNPRISDMVKFQQLKTHLKGIALDAINGFKSCAADYQAAWQTLIQRYDNDHRIVTEYIKKFFELPCLGPNPANAQFLQMINKTNQLVRVLPSFGYDVTSWDPILMYCLLARLDGRHIGKWNDQIKMRQKIPLSELIEFLEVQAAEIITANGDRPRTAYQPPKNKFARKGAKKAHVMVTVSDEPKRAQLKCAQCGNNHMTFSCRTFLALSVQDRIKKIKGAKHCFKCLNRHENGEQCTFRPCKYCEKDHNDLLCLKNDKNKNVHREKQPVAQSDE